MSTNKKKKYPSPPQVSDPSTLPQAAPYRLQQAINNYRDYVRRYGRTWLDRGES